MVVKGFQKKQTVRHMQGFVTSLSSVELISLEEPAAVLAGRVAGELEWVGRPIGCSLMRSPRPF
jgi:tRNA(fMet)-specific endonuclease VapC